MDVVGTHIFQTIVMAGPDDEDNDGGAGGSLRFTPVHRVLTRSWPKCFPSEEAPLFHSGAMKE